MDKSNVIAALVAAAAALVGAAVKGAWDYLRRRSGDVASIAKARIVDAAQIRSELWSEIEKLRDRLDAMQAELDQARRGYIELLAEHTALKAEHKALKHDHETLQRQYAVLDAELVAMRSATGQTD